MYSEDEEMDGILLLVENHSSKLYRSTVTNFERFGIHSSVYRVNSSFFVSERVNRSRLPFCNKRQEQFANSCSFVRSIESESLLGIIRGESSEKLLKTYKKRRFFSS